VFTGWVLTTGPHAVTAAQVACGIAGKRHHEAFYRLFSFVMRGWRKAA
jgi:hypothetical protein